MVVEIRIPLSPFQRLCRTEDGKWLSTTRFGCDGLLVLQKVADETHTRVMQLIGAEHEEKREEQSACRVLHLIASKASKGIRPT
jgi:hypothetical protein